MAEFFNMGGYALYVWGSFGMTAICMVIEPIAVHQREKEVRKRVARLSRLNEEGAL